MIYEVANVVSGVNNWIRTDHSVSQAPSADPLPVGFRNRKPVISYSYATLTSEKVKLSELDNSLEVFGFTPELFYPHPSKREWGREVTSPGEGPEPTGLRVVGEEVYLPQRDCESTRVMVYSGKSVIDEDPERDADAVVRSLEELGFRIQDGPHRKISGYASRAWNGLRDSLGMGNFPPK